MKPFLDIFFEQQGQKSQFVEIVLVSARGSTPANAGARAIVGSGGLLGGTVGGGKVEARAIEHAKGLLDSKEHCDFVTWNLQTDIGMTCGGEVKFYFEVHNKNAWKVAVFGAGHVAQALIPVLSTLDCSITCIDTRADWLSQLAVSHKVKTICSPFPFESVKLFSDSTQFVVMTQGHATDVPILKEVLMTKRSPFVGVIGSHAKFLVLKGDLLNAGVSEEKISRIQCPIGLPVGNSSPAEIAISVAAQLLMVRDQEDFSTRKWQKLIQRQKLSENFSSTAVTNPQSAKIEIQNELET